MAKLFPQVSSEFIWRRVHSLMGLWLVLYLIEHLLVNSQAALWIGDDGIGFIRLVDLIQALPYLQVVETLLIGVPLVLHAGWGVKRALEARTNAGRGDGSTPGLPSGRNRAFTWQRLSSWILLFGILGHVVQMRFLDKPKEAQVETTRGYFSKVSMDDGLPTLAARLGVEVYDREKIGSFRATDDPKGLVELQKAEEERQWQEVLESYTLKENQVITVSPNPGTAMLLMVRDTFKSPTFAVLYTIFVLAAAFHAFNGFWTFLITWGAILSYRSQRAMIPVSVIGMLFLSFFGLAAIWGSYWINLRH